MHRGVPCGRRQEGRRWVERQATSIGLVRNDMLDACRSKIRMTKKARATVEMTTTLKEEEEDEEEEEEEKKKKTKTKTTMRKRKRITGTTATTKGMEKNDKTIARKEQNEQNQFVRCV